jgi:integrase/recombinase XerD
MQRYDVADALAGVRPAACAQSHIEHFVEQLSGAGYALLSTRQYVQAAAHLGRWIEVRSISWPQLTDSALSTFARHRCTCPEADGRGQKLSRRYVRRIYRFVEHLRARGLVPASRHLTPPIPEALTGFQDWLRRHRGLAVCTITRYQMLVAKMLPALGEDPAAYNAALIRRVFLAQVRDLSRGYAKCFVPALRAYLRFLAVEGRCRPYLDRAVPTLPEWRLAALPRYIESADVERVIGACDLRKSCGIRDRAVLLLLARLSDYSPSMACGRARFGDCRWRISIGPLTGSRSSGPRAGIERSCRSNPRSSTPSVGMSATPGRTAIAARCS